LLKEILDQGERTNRPVTIHVEVFNRAIQLYERLGFTKVALHGVYHLLQWTPARASQPPPEEE
jgi:ribosomal protein S18 acetylase RimI-like enzyme